MSEPLNLFFAYARADQALRDELDKHLAFLRRSNLIKGWYDGNISAGEDWQQAIHQNLHTADIILLLVSPDFIASDYCYDVEMKKAMVRHEAGEAVVIPVILRPCIWEGAPFSKLQALPKDGLPITFWPHRDLGFHDAAMSIREKVTALYALRNPPLPTHNSRIGMDDIHEGSVEAKTPPNLATNSVKPDTPSKVQSVPQPSPSPKEQTKLSSLGNKPKLVIPHLSFELELVHIPAGEFIMGSDPTKDKNTRDTEQPQHRLYLPDYYIGKYPVTNVEYSTFVKATRYHGYKKWNGGSYPHGGDRHPAVYVSWHDAVAFCRWLSDEIGRTVRLPTEAEWEKAARGTDGRNYPWGNKWDKSRVNADKAGRAWASLMGFPPGTTPVGEYSPQGDSVYGCVDMCGNVSEKCSTLWQEKTYPFPVQDEWTEAYLKRKGYRVARGGSWSNLKRDIRCAVRFWSIPNDSINKGGFRVVVPPNLDSDF